MIPTNDLLKSGLSLEEEFVNEAFPRDIDLYHDCKFHDFIEPNEGMPEGIRPHLEGLSQGIHVTTGTERMFFSALFSSKSCEGFVGRDINHRVKAYNDFNILLLKISNSAEEYKRLSEFNKHREDINDKIAGIRQLAESNLLRKREKDYYTSNISSFAKIYFNADKKWRFKGEWHDSNSVPYKNCQYQLDEALFQKLRQYAISGNIISTIGNINDLKFLTNRKVSVVDTSNICDYGWIDLQGGPNFNPKIIVTSQNASKTIFQSLEQPFVPEIMRDRIYSLTSLIQKTSNEAVPFYNVRQLIHPKVPIISSEVLPQLEKYVNDNIHDIPGIGPVNLQDGANSIISEMNESQAETLIKYSGIEPYIPLILNNFYMMDPQVFLVFCEVDVWAKELMKMLQAKYFPDRLLEYIESNNIEGSFSQAVGEERYKDFMSQTNQKS